MKTLAIFISGRGSNMRAIVESCQKGILQKLAKVELVFSNKINAAGLDFAKTQNIPTAYISSKGIKRTQFDQKVVKLLESYSIDYIVLAGFMRILSPIIIQQYPERIINIHPADTTEHQGIDGYKWAFKQKLKQTKVTVHYVDEGLDTGKIIGQAVVDLQHAQTLEEVEKAGLAIEHDFYSKALAKILV